jgi:hypothetical protein
MNPDGTNAGRRKNWHETFLVALAEHGTVTAACKVAKISRVTAYRNRNEHPDFAERWDEIDAATVDELEQKAKEVALSGDPRMIEFLLKHRRREIYGDQVRHELTGPGGGPVQLQPVTDAEERSRRALELLPPEQRQALLEQAARWALESGTSGMNGNGNDE